MFTGLGTAVRFEKQGLKLRREFSRISNIRGVGMAFYGRGSRFVLLPAGGEFGGKASQGNVSGLFCDFEASQGAQWDALKSEFCSMFTGLGTLGRFEIPGSF